MKVGKVSSNVLKRSVLRQVHRGKKFVLNGAGIGENCAIFTSSNGDVIAEIMKEAAVAGSGALTGQRSLALEKDIGEPIVSMKQLMQSCANALSSAGAIPRTAMITILLPKQAEESEIKELMREADEACKMLDIQITGGQTRVTSATEITVAVVSMSGIIERNANVLTSGVNPGQDIVISKWIGLEGTAYLADIKREEILKKYPEYLVDEALLFSQFYSTVPEAAIALKSGVCGMHNASEGGILGAIWELAEKAGVGLTMELKKLPIRQETVEICECLGINPYELKCGGCLIMTSSDGLKLKSDLEAAGIPAAIVGKITDSNDRIILNDDEIRFMDRPKQDELYRYLESIK